MKTTLLRYLRTLSVGLGLLVWSLLLATSAQATTRYVSKSGSDGNSCSTSQSSGSSAKFTINGGIQCMSGGDILIIQNGTYDEQISDGEHLSNYNPVIPPAGSSGAYTTIKAENIHGARIRASGSGPVVIIENNSHHIRLEGLTIDTEFKENGMTICGRIHQHDMQIVDVECQAGGQGFTTSGANVLYQRVWIHDIGYDRSGNGNCCGGSECGNSFCHGIYIQSNPGTSVTVQDSYIKHTNGWGIQSYEPDVLITNNNIEQNDTSGVIIIPGGGGLPTITNNCFAAWDQGNYGYSGPISCGGGCNISGNSTPGDCPDFAQAPPPTASALNFIQQPTTTVQNATITPSITVRAIDSDGQLVTSFTGTITLTINTNPGSGTLAGTVTRTAASGIATFNNLSINNVGTGYRLEAASGSSPGLTHAVSSTFNITSAAVATALQFVAQPTNTMAGAAIAPAVTVRVIDQFGQTFSSTATVAMAIGTNPGSGTLTGTTSVAVAGLTPASFSNLHINNAGVGYTLVASSSGLTSATSNAFQVVPAGGMNQVVVLVTIGGGMVP